MTTQAYLVVDVPSDTVVNNVMWDGVSPWIPPDNSLLLVKATTPALIWELDNTKTWVLTEVMGAGEIGFTWDGTVLTTDAAKPEPIVQPTTTGTQTA